MTKFRFPTKRRVAKIKPAGRTRELAAPQEVLTPIQGQKPGSKEEWRVAMALYATNHQFEYQHAVFGGRMTGGQIIDFWVTDTYMPTPIFMNGRAWHNNKNASADEYKYYKLKKVYHGYIREPLIIWDDEVPTIEAAISILRRRL
jgi:hypothetical protein